MPEPEHKSALPVGCMAPLNVEEAALALEERLATSGVDAFRPIPTGFIDLDGALGGGLHAGDLHLLGGPQNIGKTSMVLQMATSIAEDGALALIVNYEHSVETLWERLLCQRGFAGEMATSVTADALNEAYLSTIRARENGGLTGQTGEPPRYLDRVLGQVPAGMAAWQRVSRAGQDIWMVTGHGVYTTIDALEHYVDFAMTRNNRVVLIVDYLQEVPVISTERRLYPEERIERVLAGLKGLALRYTNEGAVLSVIAVAAADAEGLRKGRIHLENLWGNATVQYKPDVAWIGNRERAGRDGTSIVRWAVEKNRRGPSELEFRHPYYGAAYSFDREGQAVEPADSWQVERGARALRDGEGKRGPSER